MKLNYNELENEILELLTKSHTMVLATCLNNKVSARNMSCIVVDKKIYFQTDKNFLKFKQIDSNVNVALCIDNIQIEGVAKIKGHPFDEQNIKFREVYQKIHHNSYNNYSSLDSEVVIEVTMQLITLWKYIDGKPLRDILDVDKKVATREFYNTK